MLLVNKRQNFFAVIFGCLFFNSTLYGFGEADLSPGAGSSILDDGEFFVNLFKVLIPGVAAGVVGLAIYDSNRNNRDATPTSVTTVSKAYIVHTPTSSSYISVCDVNSDTKYLESCSTVTGTTFDTDTAKPMDIILNADGTKAYIPLKSESVRVCDVENYTTFQNCQDFTYDIGATSSTKGVSINGSYLYVAYGSNEKVAYCPINANGSLGSFSSFVRPNGYSGSAVSFKDNKIYGFYYGTTTFIYACDINGAGGSDNCNVQGNLDYSYSSGSTPPTYVYGIAWDNAKNYLYIAGKKFFSDSVIYRCSLSGDSTSLTCETFLSGIPLSFTGGVSEKFFVTDKNIYVPNIGNSETFVQCSIDGDANNPNVTCSTVNGINDTPIKVWVQEFTV